MELVFTRLLDRLNATQRTRQIIINVGLFILALIAFVSGNPTFEIGPQAVKWIAVLAFFGNALAGIVSIPNRMVPVGYNLIENPKTGKWRIEKSKPTNWLSLIFDMLKFTDQLKTILVNVGIFIGLAIALFVGEGVVSENLPKWIAAIGFIGNALAGMLNVPERSVPEGYLLRQNSEGIFYLEENVQENEEIELEDDKPEFAKSFDRAATATQRLGKSLNFDPIFRF